ncbi:MAG: acyl-ACP--UDP-N-acetylglucosamine O-acyltransferase [candidate division KSB1 bacterium]|nr:acyl-ACP--UDP-N-acetylglucosamine O-acyltransferase [candidate division KSB1 bacterium]MDZ7317994.1 acyl-ACP--UDP-N-acetylglucosamine O-acyltransferase [candidate division KSB1 bacterium]MDZ7340649.1 acyl-ACP--UDP-N-acetylglucosamine O-acyltransferase [candidate division KSB1 bacterium]
MNIHPTAIIDPRAQLGENVIVGPFTIIEDDVTIGNDVQIASHVLIHAGTRIGNRCRIFKGSVLGTDPQDLKYAGEKTTLEIGDDTTVREFCTLNRGSSHRQRTVIGKKCLLMAYVHVAHDCILGDNVILANAVNMAGHVTIEEYVSIGGMTPIHQFVKIGRHAFVGGGLRVNQDVPPYILAAGEPIQFAGINRVGLTRRGFSADTLSRLKQVYKLIYRSGLNTTQALQQIEATIELTPEVKYVVDFIKSSERGIIK